MDGGEIVDLVGTLGIEAVVTAVVVIIVDVIAVVMVINAGELLLTFTWASTVCTFCCSTQTVVFKIGDENVFWAAPVTVFVVAVSSIVLGGRLGAILSGSGLVGAFPYWNVPDASVVDVIVDVVVDVSSHFSIAPVDPTRVIALRFDGDVGALWVLSLDIDEN